MIEKEEGTITITGHPPRHDIDECIIIAKDAKGETLSCKVHELIYNKSEGIYYIFNTPVKEVQIQTKA